MPKILKGIKNIELPSLRTLSFWGVNMESNLEVFEILDLPNLDELFFDQCPITCLKSIRKASFKKLKSFYIIKLENSD